MTLENPEVRGDSIVGVGSRNFLGRAREASVLISDIRRFEVRGFSTNQTIGLAVGLAVLFWAGYLVVQGLSDLIRSKIGTDTTNISTSRLDMQRFERVFTSRDEVLTEGLTGLDGQFNALIAARNPAEAQRLEQQYVSEAQGTDRRVIVLGSDGVRINGRLDPAADFNALIKVGQSDSDKVIYITTMPCKMCAKMIVNSGASKVYFARSYRLSEGRKILERAGIKMEKLTH